MGQSKEQVALEKKVWGAVQGGLSDLTVDAMRTYVLRKET